MRGRTGGMKRSISSLHLLSLFIACTRIGLAEKSLEAVLLAEAESEFAYIQDIRRTVHQHPELLFEEQQTSAYIRKKLDELKIPYKHPVAKTGIVATLGTGKAPKYALRTDIDALPIEEEVQVEFKSKVAGKMHACGHDAHIAMLLGAAKILKAREAQLEGTILLLFQPAEEGGAGGKFMVDEGVMEGVSGVHGVHVWPSSESGVITTRAGVMMAGADELHVTVNGKGGHAAMPHLTVDPVVAAAAIVTSLQQLVSRVSSPTSAPVVSITRFNAGEGATNVIPDSVKLGGTMRALSLEQQDDIRERINKVVENVASAHGCTTEIQWTKIPYIPVINDEAVFKLVKRIADRFVGQQQRWEAMPEPFMVGEDFGFLSQASPGCFTYLGIRNETCGAVHGLHTGKFTLDENVLPRGAALHAAVAFEFLAQHQQTGHSEL